MSNRMSDEEAPPASAIGPDGEPLVGLETRHERPPEQRRPRRAPRTDRRGALPLADPLPSAVLESQIHCSAGIDLGPLVAET